MTDTNSWLLAGKTLNELNFPEDWEYDATMMRWRSEKHKVKIHFLYSSYQTDKKKGDISEEYVYITDKMLLNQLKGEK